MAIFAAFSHLMIYVHLPDIIQLIIDNWVSRVSAETGSGKSIGVVGALALSGKRVFVSVPTRVAARSLCDYLRKLCPNLQIGFAAEGQIEYDEKTRVVYATKAHISHLLIRQHAINQDYNFADIIVLDEIHTGTIDDSICASLLMKAHDANLKVPQLVLMSATPTEMPIKPDPAVYEIPVPRPFPVDIIYYPRIQSPYDGVIGLVHQIHCADITSGNYLIFASGSAEVDGIVAKLEKIIKNCRIVPVYAALDVEQLNEIYLPTPADMKRTIFVATNIAESSITIENVNHVFDLMDQKAIRDEVLVPCEITKDAAIQRMGRTGRTCPGTCHRICSKDTYTKMLDHETPEITRVCIHEVVIKMIDAYIDPAETIFHIERHKVERSVSLLLSLQMLEENNNCGVFESTSGKYLCTTNAGRFAASVPLTIYNAAFLYAWLKEGLPMYPGVVIACIINSCDRDYLYVPFKRNDPNYASKCEDYIDAKFGKWIGATTIHTYLNMWLEMVNRLEDMDRSKKHHNRHYKTVTEPWSNRQFNWCKKNSVHCRAFTELMLAVSRTYQTCTIFRIPRIKIDKNIASFEPTMADTAIPILQKVFGSFEMEYQQYMRSAGSDMSYTLRQDKCFSRLEENPTSHIIPLASHNIRTRRGILAIVTMAIPGVTKEEDCYYSDDDDIDAVISHNFGGLTLEEADAYYLKLEAANAAAWEQLYLQTVSQPIPRPTGRFA